MKRKLAAGTENQLTKGAALTRRQTLQWQLVSSLAGPPASYSTKPQKQPPRIAVEPMPLSSVALQLDDVVIGISDVHRRPHSFGSIALADVARLDAVA